MRHIPYIDRVSHTESISNFIGNPREDRHCLFVAGSLGLGKTVLMRTAAESYALKVPQDVSVSLSYQGNFPLIVQLTLFEDVIRKCLIKQSHHELLRTTGSYLAQILYGDVRFADEPKIDVEVKPQSDIILRRTVLELSQKQSHRDILERFGRWVGAISEGILPNKLVLFIDSSDLREPDDLVDLLVHLVQLRAPNLYIVCSLDPKTVNHASNISGLHMDSSSRLDMQPFGKDEVRQLITMVDGLLSLEEHELIWTLHRGNPLGTFISAVTASYSGQVNIQSYQETYAQLISALDPMYGSLHEILAIARGTTSISTIAYILEIDVSQATLMAESSPIVHIVEGYDGDTHGATLFHSTVVEPILLNMPTERRNNIAIALAKSYAPNGNFVSEYHFYASYPDKLIKRLNLLSQADPMGYLSLLTSAATRVLLRQWTAEKYTLMHLKTALEQYDDWLLPAQHSTLLSDMGYFLSATGNENDAKGYYVKAVEVFTIRDDKTDLESAASMLSQAEALSQHADFLRKQGKYQDAIETLQKARFHYETLLEVILSSRAAIEMEIAQVTHNLGIIWRDYANSSPRGSQQAITRLIRALACFEEAYTVEKLHENVTGQIAALTQLSLVSAYLGLNEEAEQAFSLLKELSHLTNDARSVANLAGNLAIHFLGENISQPHAAAKYASIATELFRAIGDTEQELLSQELLRQALAQLPSNE